MQGLLLIDKPIGWTSFDVVNYVRKNVALAEAKKPKNCKVGHTGTLDPLATGLLILLVGKVFTRRAAEFSKLDKVYQVTMKLGENSSTGDGEGEKLTISHKQPKLNEIESVLSEFMGELMQKPPLYSAIKVKGQRAYKLARQGKTVELEARPIIIYNNQLIKYDYPLVTFTSEVSSGTYIRSLVEDMGKWLKCGAYLTELRRTHIGSYNLESAVTIDSNHLLDNIMII